jgi:proteasome lid subunit RPN8/RPN11
MKKNLDNTKEPMKLTRRQSTLRFSPTAWAKLLYLRDLGDTEIGGFGISLAGDLLSVEDVQLVSQVCTWAHVEFDDAAVADFFDRQVDAGRRPEEFGRIWVHTHPGTSAVPSGTDEATFARAFGGADWALMFILARGGQTYARLRYNCGPGVEVKIAVEVDFGRPFTGSDSEAWKADYSANVRAPESESKIVATVPVIRSREDDFFEDSWRDVWDDYGESGRYRSEGEHGFIEDF